ncbi:MAG TPA: NADH-quinone oxidoreductase subunit C [Pseudomonadota bacterium]|jgi:NADH-quinone oxidoreductase subunit C|nr:NADH-quinone oxidoreductase subunit C [Pseudomonadota bacterium]
MSKADLDKLVARFPDAVLSSHSAHGDDTAVVAKDQAKEVLRHLRDECGFDFLVSVTAVDYFDRTPRFEVVYHLRSMSTGNRLRIKVGVHEEEDGPKAEVATVVDLWPTANWQEREVYDLFGIKFSEHPDLRRILMYEEFVGHPLRKDYPKEQRQPLIRRDYSLG